MARWSAGGFTHETVEGTAQRNAKALGMVDCLDQTIEYLEELAQSEVPK